MGWSDEEAKSSSQASRFFLCLLFFFFCLSLLSSGLPQALCRTEARGGKRWGEQRRETRTKVRRRGEGERGKVGEGKKKRRERERNRDREDESSPLRQQAQMKIEAGLNAQGALSIFACYLIQPPLFLAVVSTSLIHNIFAPSTSSPPPPPSTTNHRQQHSLE